MNLEVIIIDSIWQILLKAYKVEGVKIQSIKFILSIAFLSKKELKKFLLKVKKKDKTISKS